MPKYDMFHWIRMKIEIYNLLAELNLADSFNHDKVVQPIIDKANKEGLTPQQAVDIIIKQNKEEQ